MNTENDSFESSKSELLSTPELSKMLKTSESWVRKKVFRKELPFYKIGNSVRFKREDILNWIELNKREVQVSAKGAV